MTRSYLTVLLKQQTNQIQGRKFKGTRKESSERLQKYVKVYFLPSGRDGRHTASGYGVLLCCSQMAGVTNIP